MQENVITNTITSEKTGDIIVSLTERKISNGSQTNRNIEAVILKSIPERFIAVITEYIENNVAEFEANFSTIDIFWNALIFVGWDISNEELLKGFINTQQIAAVIYYYCLLMDEYSKNKLDIFNENRDEKLSESDICGDEFMKDLLDASFLLEKDSDLASKNSRPKSR